MGQHRMRRTRPRYGRLAAALSSLGVTTVALMGGVGMLPSSAEGPDVASGMVLDASSTVAGPPDAASGSTPGRLGSGARPAAPHPVAAQVTVEATDTPRYPLPVGSGDGRRVVFSQSGQRVWLVGGDGSVQRTYLVSGSLTDNLDPGTYAVYSRSAQAWGIDDSGTMQWFVRFTTGDTGAAIGFHDIPVDDGAPAQTVSQLGTEQSHGCIRQRESDAKALWAFAPLETTVVVTP